MNLVFTFNNPAEITYQLVESLKTKYWEKYFIDTDELDQFFEKIEHGNYQHILGIGNYYRRGNLFRIQQKFVNKRRGKFILQNGIWEHNPDWKITEVWHKSSMTDEVRTDMSNKVSYLVMHMKKQKKITSRFAFLYVPTNADFQKSSQYLKEVMNYDEPSPIIW